MDQKPFRISYKGCSRIRLTKEEERECYFYELRNRLSVNQSSDHHLILIGLTESMAASLDVVKKSLKNILQTVAKYENQYISLVVFGGHHTADALCLGVRAQTSTYRTMKLYKRIEEALSGISGCVYSEALEYIQIRLKELDAFNEMRHHLYLISDEESIPSKWDLAEEEKRCYEVARWFKQSDISMDAIGMGHFYNRAFLLKLIKIGGGKLLHADHLREMKKRLTSLIEEERERVSYAFKNQPQRAFLAGDYRILIENKEKVIKPRQRDLLITYDEPLKQSGDKKDFLDKEVSGQLKEEFLYHLAAYEFNEGRIDNSLFLIAELGDKGAYHIIRNSYTMIEQARSQNFLYELAEHDKSRYKRGRERIEIEAESNAEPLCLLELLRLIMDDCEAKLLWDYGTLYEYSGIKKKMLPSQYVFIRPDEGYGEVDRLLIGGKKLNIGLRVKVKGQVEDIETHLKLDAAIYREYHLVVNGNLKVDNLQCLLSKTLKKKLKKEQLIKQHFKYGTKEVYVLNLKKMKLFNRRIEKSLSQSQIVRTLYEIEDMKLREKIIKELMDNLHQKEGALVKDQSFQEMEYSKLKKKFGISDKGIFIPKGVEEEERPVKIYRGIILEWSIEQPVKADLKENMQSYYKIGVYESAFEECLRLEAELRLLKYERYRKELELQAVRLFYGIKHKEFEDWDEKKIISKKGTEAGLVRNTVIGGEKEVAKKEINHLTFRQERYETLIKCSLSV